MSVLSLPSIAPVPKVAAVSYLNTVPLVWGATQGQQRQSMQVEFHLPSACADLVRNGKADIGILPVIEIARQNLEILSGTCIASDGPVRSILLVSRVPFNQIRTLACDWGSRTSVMLARILLAKKYKVEPTLLPPATPNLEQMLETADAALIIGDPALRIEPNSLPYCWADLGKEWQDLTGLPMVFAAWAGQAKWVTPALETAFLRSLEAGFENMERIVTEQATKRGFPDTIVRHYLTENIRFQLGQRELEGMRTFLAMAAQLEPNLHPLAIATSTK
jgi:chorismate dehydratase